MSLYRTASEIASDFSRKSQNFPTPRTLRLRLELGIGAGAKEN